MSDLSEIVKVKGREFRRLRNMDGLDDLANYVMDILENKIRVDKENPIVRDQFTSLQGEVKGILDGKRRKRSLH